MKYRVALLVIFFSTAFLSVFSQNTLQEKLDLAFEFKENGDISGIEFILNDIEPECGESASDYIRDQFLYLKGHVLYERDKYQETIPVLIELIALLEKHNEINAERISCMDGLADCYYHVGEYTKAAKLYRKVFLLGKDILEQYPDHASEVAIGLASVYLAQNDTAMVEDVYNLAVDYAVKAYKKEHPNDLHPLDAYNQACHSLEEAKNAKGTSSEAYVKALLEKAHSTLSIDGHPSIYMYNCSQAIRIAKNSIGLDNQVMRPFYDEMMNYLSFYDSIADLNAILPIALDYWKSVNDTTIEHTIYSKHQDFAFVLNGIGQYEHSLDYSIKNEEYLEKHLDQWNRKSLSFLNYINLLESYIGLGNHNKTSYYSNQLIELANHSNVDDQTCLYLIQNCQRALNKSRYELTIEFCNVALKYIEIYGNADPAYINVTNIRGIAFLNLNMLNEAEKDFTQAIKMCKTQEMKDKIFPYLLNNIGKVYMLRGEHKTAIQYLRQAVDYQLKANGAIDKKTQYYLNYCTAKL